MGWRMRIGVGVLSMTSCAESGVAPSGFQADFDACQEVRGRTYEWEGKTSCEGCLTVLIFDYLPETVVWIDDDVPYQLRYGCNGTEIWATTTGSSGETLFAQGEADPDTGVLWWEGKRYLPWD